MDLRVIEQMYTIQTGLLNTGLKLDLMYIKKTLTFCIVDYCTNELDDVWMVAYSCRREIYLRFYQHFITFCVALCKSSLILIILEP